ncbi:MAG: serine/threonine-protein kinase, partial [Chloroflexota bacterium]
MQNDLPTVAMSDSDPLIAKRYRLGRLLGRGAFGEVYYAEDLKYEPPRVVSLKLLHPQHFRDPQVREELKREASALARFNHPNILRILDFDIGDDLAFIVTEYAAGGSLARKLQPDPSKPPVALPLPEVSRYLEQITSALDEAHSQGVIHRDIKPQNILLDGQGRPLLADFGLAAAVSTSAASALLQTNTSGTPLYMAPEQWEGQAGKASDIYALAVVTYQLIAGQAPYQGNQSALAWQHMEAPVPRLVERSAGLNYPPALDQVIAEAMSKDPHKRPRPASEFYRRFQAVLEQENKPSPWPSPYLPPAANATPPAYSPTPTTQAHVPPDAPPTVLAVAPPKGKSGLMWLVIGLLGVALFAVVGLVSLNFLGPLEIKPTAISKVT